MTDKDRLAKLSLRRQVPLNRLKEIQDYAANRTADEFYKQNFLARCEFTNTIYEEFQEIHNLIVSEITTDADFGIQDKIRATADKYFYDIQSKKIEIQSSLTVAPILGPANNASSNSCVKLPKINVPIFDGNAKQWPTFFDLYNSIIHQNSTLSDIEKFQYLLTCLKNEPFNLVKSVPMTNENYQIVYATLVKRFQNKRFLATTYFNEIYTAQQLQRPSYKDLRQLLDTFSENLAALQALAFDVDSWDFLLFNILLQKLDTKTRTDFELEHSKLDMPTYQILIMFLNNQCKALESVQYMIPTQNKTKNVGLSKNTTSQVSSFQKSHAASSYVTTVESNPPKVNNAQCLLCTASHALYRCQLFLAKPPPERLSFVKQNNLCVNCLRSQHSVRNCSSSNRCKLCKFPHHSTLHLNSVKTNGAQVSPATGHASSSSASQLSPVGNTLPAPDNDQSFQALQCSTPIPFVRHSTILLSTAEVDIQDSVGTFQKVRVLFDTASTANLITDRCAHRLGLKRRHFPVPIEGINNLVSTSNKGVTQCFIKPCGKDSPTFTFDAIVLPRVCSDQPKVTINTRNLSYLDKLPLADKRFHSPGPIDILLSAELVPYMLGSGRIVGEPGQPVALETVFGWILQGKTEGMIQNTSLLSCHASLDIPIDFTLQRFWEIEQPAAPKILMSPDDIKCEEIYKDLVYRDTSGKFIVPLPFKHPNPDFGDTYTQALRRFTSLESRLYKNPSLQVCYSNFIREYIEKGYISRVPVSDYRSTSAFYLPHHCVLKPDSVSTKIRVVYDASAKGTNGISLNDTLFPGPKLQQDLSAILLKFRTYPVAFICDIQQMYCQIFVRKEHTKFQRFLWRFSNSENIDEYTLNRVTFGVSAAPYLALRTLKELSTIEQDKHPLAAKIIQDSIYMDDCVCGADSVDDALYVQSELIALLSKGGFNLGKWASNHPSVLSAVPHAQTHMPLSFQSESPSFIKVLGLQWDPIRDLFSYAYTKTESECTKRTILSQIARIFDPLGFLSPTVFLAKHILQQLWLSKASWDDIPSQNIVEMWERFKSELPEISKIRMPRILVDDTVSRLELHGFADASTLGYGCAVYFKFVTRHGLVRIVLVSGKSRVAPLKSVSLPRLELCAAHLLANLVAFVKDSYSELLTFDSTYAWSDSQVALAWLSASPHRWKTFVANRVAQIQEVIPASSWRYVPTSENPADCVSRGLTPAQLLDHTLWWQGPDFLAEETSNWPKQPTILLDKIPEASLEKKQVSLHVSVSENSIIPSLLLTFSSLRKIQKILSYVLKFLFKAKGHKTSSAGDITPDAHTALQVIIKHVQRECFHEIILACERNTSLPKPFRKLALFLDELGMLRVGGRLRKSSLSFDAKHPILLPKTHRLTDLIIEQVHRENLHPGLKTLHNLIIQNFWILSPRSAIYRCLSKCMKCFRVKPRAYTPFMADLPAFRISQIKAFSQVTLDYAGPFLVTMGKHRGAKTTKAYICLFVCCATKALHLELASDLSTDAFLACFRRFISRRGRVSDVHSDQGTNFRGALNQLTVFSADAAQKLSINWHLNPPAAPHFNGLSEANVKSVKTHIHRVVGEQIMTYEEFYTLLTQIECVLNSRPLTAISEDPNDLTPLTPGHFLTMEPLSTLPEPAFANTPLNRLSRWQMLQKMHADFWKRWSLEYLHTLQQRTKWTKSTPDLKPNMLVLVKDEQKPPLQWLLGRIIKLHPGTDGVVRVVTLKTPSGSFQRPVVKVCPLPGQ